MTHVAALISNPDLTIVMAVAGFIFGVLYFAALKRTVALFATGRGWFGPVALTLGRIGAAVVFLVIVAKLGAAPLLAALVGFLLARFIALRAVRRAG